MPCDGCKVDLEKKEVCYDMSNERGHVFNQSDVADVDRNSRMLDILMDSQSTCSIIVNHKMLSNIRLCEWVLRLQT